VSGLTPRAILWRLAAALLPGGFGALALINWTDDWNSAESVGQHIAGAGVLIYGPVGAAAAVALLMGKRVGRTLTLLWGVIATTVATLAPVVWGGAPVSAAIFSCFGASVLVAAALWAATQATPAPATP
jgi:hypothetical protein